LEGEEGPALLNEEWRGGVALKTLVSMWVSELERGIVAGGCWRWARRRKGEGKKGEFGEGKKGDFGRGGGLCWLDRKQGAFYLNGDERRERRKRERRDKKARRTRREKQRDSEKVKSTGAKKSRVERRFHHSIEECFSLLRCNAPFLDTILVATSLPTKSPERKESKCGKEREGVKKITTLRLFTRLQSTDAPEGSAGSSGTLLHRATAPSSPKAKTGERGRASSRHRRSRPRRASLCTRGRGRRRIGRWVGR
jgi:hypothetical protein